MVDRCLLEAIDRFGPSTDLTRPGANDSSLYWHDCAPSSDDGLATAQIIGVSIAGRARRGAIKVGMKGQGSVGCARPRMVI